MVERKKTYQEISSIYKMVQDYLKLDALSNSDTFNSEYNDRLQESERVGQAVHLVDNIVNRLKQVDGGAEMMKEALKQVVMSLWEQKGRTLYETHGVERGIENRRVP